MKINTVKLIGLLSIIAVLISLLAIGNLLAGPSAQTAGTVTLSGGALDDTGLKAEGVFFSDKKDFNIVTVDVDDADLSLTRTGVAWFGFSGDAATPINSTDVFDLTFAALVKPILQGEKDKVVKFSGKVLAGGGRRMRITRL